MALHLISKRGPSGAGVPIVCPVRDEMGLAPHFLAHHRALGVEDFIFIDNDSKDGTADYLLSQPDCAVYHTTDSFQQAHYAADWVSEVLQKHVKGRWGVYLDCDELLVYPGMETTPLAEFAAWYQRDGFDSFMAIMIDMYPEGAWGRVSARESRPILEALNCFDKDYIVRVRPEKPWRRTGVRGIEVLGGPRTRLFTTLEKEARRGWFDYTVAGQVDRFVDAVPISIMPTLARVWPRSMSAIFKTPLNLIGDNFYYSYSHESSNSRLAPVMLGVLHLKFCDELNARFDPEFSYRHHYQRGLERFRVAGALQRLGTDSLTYAGTRRYRSSDDLLKHDIIGEGPARIWSQGIDLFRTGLSGSREQPDNGSRTVKREAIGTS